MADVQKAIVINGIHTNLIDPSSGKSVNYKETLIWYDGTPMTNAKCDGNLYRKKGTKYLRKIIDKDGELFLEKDTVAQLRALSSYEILLLRSGVYKGVTLSGYYSKGDTPRAIQYYLSDTTESDDGGSVFEVGGIKLEHNFGEEIDIRYFGAKPELGFDNSDIIQTVFDKGVNNVITNIEDKEYEVSKWCTAKSNIVGIGFPILKMTTAGGADENSVIRVQNYIKNEYLNITGLRIKGTYPGTGSSGEWAHGIRILGSKNVNILNCVIEDSYGDNIYIGAGDSSIQHNCENITCENNILLRPRRCNFGVIAGKNIFIRKNNIVKLTNYVASIDLEPNKNSMQDTLNDIHIDENIYDVPNGYFINFYDPKTRVHNNFTITRNIGNATYFMRVTGEGTGLFQNITVDSNTFGGTGRMFLVSINAQKITITRNKDYSADSSGWAINDQNGIVIKDNEIDYNLRHGIIFTNTTNIDMSGNWFKNLYRAIVFRGDTVVPSDNKINSNYFINNNVNFRFETKVLRTVLDGNFLASNQYNVQLTAAAGLSDIKVLPSNYLIGGVNFNGSQYIEKQFNSNGRDSTYAASMPSRGYYEQGAKTWKTDASSGSILGWICTTSGYATNRSWLASSAYSLGTQVKSGANVYEVTTAGTSGTVAISGTSGSINDGTVVWKYIGVASSFEVFGYVGNIPNATTTIKGLVNQSAASADTAISPSATYDQAEVQAILTELRDLKTKLRTAGILAI